MQVRKPYILACNERSTWEVRLLVDEQQPAAYHSVVWDGRDRAGRPLPSGIYIARLVAGDFVAGIKMVLLK